MAEAARRVRVIFADDEPLGRASLRSLLEADPEVEIVGECVNGVEALKAVRSERPELLFLDIQMPGLSGFEVAEELEEDPPVIIFATAFDQYALAAFEVNAVDYLLKPFDDERFRQALLRAKQRLASNSARTVGEELSGLLATLAAQRSAAADPQEIVTRLTIPREGRMDLVETVDLHWVEASDQYVMLHTAHGEFLMRESMGRLERILDPEAFQRTHRSTIVAVHQIRTLERLGGGVGRIQIADGTWLPVSRSRMASVRARLE
ncbi:MAG: LytTR family DNA-binding domain-containing protein [bacterium]|jgi:two-component system LytT family response regulator|nr:response regulator transcription factor [Planctomycetota bacterium]HIL50869.1 response regulator transcription factor [Planctomycetota bacterium]